MIITVIFHFQYIQVMTSQYYTNFIQVVAFPTLSSKKPQLRFLCSKVTFHFSLANQDYLIHLAAGLGFLNTK